MPVGAPEPWSEAGCHIAKADAHVRASVLLDVLLHLVEKAPRRFREGAVAFYVPSVNTATSHLGVPGSRRLD